ncbi:MAG: hypothetical protein KGJ62_00135 [Armatimonadetes bacterium]|nr:hypothetical protein [Armatimonadota bacterium]MDE2206031.1 hypothetical protein [Armatimonadota bacterium]
MKRIRSWTAVAAGLLLCVGSVCISATAGAQAAGAMYRLHVNRDGATGVTHLTVDASHTGPAVSRLVFGNFLEHLDHAIYGGLWAQILLNPSLEQAASSETVPPDWAFTGGAVWQTGGYQSPLCVRLNAPVAGQPNSALSQAIYLPEERTGTYRGYLYSRVVDQPATLRITLEGAAQNWPPPATGPLAGGIEQSTLQAVTRGWRKQAFVIHLAPTVPAGTQVRLVIENMAGGAADVDRLELWPGDSELQFDPNVLKLAQDLHPATIRWPGGNFASQYHWMDGLGLEDRRVTRPNLAWGGVEPNSFGINEFIHLCDLTFAQPQITVNAGNGTPEEAADLVQYCNAEPHLKYSLMRATNRSPDPYGVKLWEVGNEMYGSWQIGHTDASGYAQRYVKYRDAMLAQDSSIQLIACGEGDLYSPMGLRDDGRWNLTLLHIAGLDGGREPEFLALHPLLPMPGSLRGLPYDSQYASIAAFPQYIDRTYIPEMERQIRAVEGAGGKTHLAFTEWGMITGGPTWRQSPNCVTLAGAIYNALFLNAMLRHSGAVRLSNVTGLMHGGGIKKHQGIVTVDPQYYTQLLYDTAGIEQPVAISETGPGESVPARGDLPAVNDVPDVDAFAATTHIGGRLVVFLVNRRASAPRSVALTLAGAAVGGVKATILTGSTLQTANTVAHRDAVHPAPFPLPAWHGNEIDLTLPAHALVVLHIGA